MKASKIYSDNSEKLQAAIALAEGKATARCLTAAQIADRLKEAEKY